jgi:RNA polymerase sigma-70 factor (ECF subfamily)
MNLLVTQRSDQPTHLDQDDREIIQALYEPLRRYAGAVGSVDVEPDDLVQEAFLRVLRKGPLRRLSDPGAYLRRTIVNIASNERRRLGRLRVALPSLVDTETVQGIVLSDVSELLRLDPRARAVLFLNAVEGYSFKEVGEIVGCSEAAARKIASRARRKLRATMTSEEVGDANA